MSATKLGALAAIVIAIAATEVRAQDVAPTTEDASADATTPVAEPVVTAPPAVEAPPPQRAIARGRGVTWGLALVVPVLVTDVIEANGHVIDYIAPGGGVDGRVGFELSGGISLGVTGGVSAHASQNSRSLAMYRGGVEARWTVDLGDMVAPSFGIAAGVLLVELDAGLQVTAYGRVLAGVQLMFAPWVAMELGVSVEGALGLDAFRDPILWVSPQVGISFYE
ncbi:hypothetical protein [Sandaracinus amylolyticus]|uniref:Outer membrane protein beta-barrel domain-containing protein n=1 Tax=Sandaracinus amylolyticus TaxID=927083 RepID=A0A0F6YM85_9BACT|nr:hypothetical protein [Sandaracinus amylolyticus]AKF10678.1 hypothetical protein DB32_007827 [Sandaracinus amylolyticus]